MHDSSAPRVFETTHWSLVLAAGSAGADLERANRALGALCRAYWYPLYAFVRRRGYGPADAEDLIQGFFAGLIEKEMVRAADPDRGRFRSFLLGALNHFLGHDRERRQAQKRGGQITFVALDGVDPEARYALEPVDTIGPEAHFHRVWAREVNQRALLGLAREMTQVGKGDQFEALKPALSGELPDRSAVAARNGLSEGALKVAVYRMRKRYREFLRAEIAETVGDASEVDAEMRALVDALVQS